jgi:signal transduction histidine kinase
VNARYAFNGFPKPTRKLKVITDIDYPPYSFLDEQGNITGYSIEVAKAVFEAAGYDYDLLITTWNEAIARFKNDSLDVVIGMNYSEDRAQKYAFNFPFDYIYYDFITLANSPYQSQDDLRGKKIIVVSNFLSHEYLVSIQFSDSLVIAQNLVEGLQLLQMGKGDALISNRRSAQYYIHEYYSPDKFQLITSEMPPFEHSMVTHLYDLKLLSELDKGYFIIKENGTLDAIYTKWFGEYDYIAKYKTLVYFLIIIGSVLFISFIFVVLLRHNVKKATHALRTSRSSLIESNQELDQKIAELEIKDKKLREAKENAEHSDRLKSLFLANMSHEIRTPLNAIVGFSELLTDEEDKNIRNDYSKLITTNSTLLLSIINDILDLSKIESGIIDLEPSNFDFADNFQQLGKSLEQQINNPKVKFIVETPYKECRIKGDKYRLSQIITNFVTNAIKFTYEGNIKMGYNYQDDGLYIYVKDTGIGIQPEHQEKIFERFFKVNQFSQGTGLGMPICKAIIEATGGKIGVISKFGKGATFWIFYPCKATLV